MRKVAIAAATVLLLAACGSTDSKHAARRPSGPPVCNPRALDAIARFLAVSPSTIATAKSIGNNAMPQCTFTARAAAGQRVIVVANVDDSPSPYFVLERTIVEASQIFGPVRFNPAPVSVTGVGIEAAWFPNYDWLKATDGLRLITATVNWKGAKQSREIALARAAIRPYLKKLSAKEQQAIAQGYPAG